jgi:HlyD family secretion protein
MKRSLTLLFVLVFLVLVGGTFWFLWKKSQKKPVEYQTESPEVMDIVKKTVATGAIVPREEVEIKPRVSGVLETVVEPGQAVKAGDQIAKIQIIPDAASLNRAENDVRAKKLAVDNARRELTRNQALFDKGILPDADMQNVRNQFALAEQAYNAASSELQIVREGQARGAKGSNVIVTSTVTGMVIDVPVKVGFSVIESNTFNAGTTIALVADMNDMIFDGQVDESEVGKIKEGMGLRIKIGALEELFNGKLEYIAPKGKEVEGAIQFQIKAAIERKPNVFIRAGYSANADIVLDERKQVLTVREAVVQFEGEKPFVEVESGGAQNFVRKDLKLGLSDGIHVEVLSGLEKGDKIKVPGNAGPSGEGGGRGQAPGQRPRRAR